MIRLFPIVLVALLFQACASYSGGTGYSVYSASTGTTQYYDAGYGSGESYFLTGYHPWWSTGYYHAYPYWHHTYYSPYFYPPYFAFWYPSYYYYPYSRHVYRAGAGDYSSGFQERLYQRPGSGLSRRPINENGEYRGGLDEASLVRESRAKPKLRPKPVTPGSGSISTPPARSVADRQVQPVQPTRSSQVSRPGRMRYDGERARSDRKRD